MAHRPVVMLAGRSSHVPRVVGHANRLCTSCGGLSHALTLCQLSCWLCWILHVHCVNVLASSQRAHVVELSRPFLDLIIDFTFSFIVGLRVSPTHAILSFDAMMFRLGCILGAIARTSDTSLEKHCGTPCIAHNDWFMSLLHEGGVGGRIRSCRDIATRCHE